jgi:hypothetical protein
VTCRTPCVRSQLECFDECALFEIVVVEEEEEEEEEEVVR